MSAPRFDELAQRLVAGTKGDRSRLFGVRVPLRMCPLGAHVDHQGGRVTGVALDRGVSLVAHVREEPVLRVTSLDFPGVATVDLREPLPVAGGDWGDYVRAAVSALRATHPVARGFDAIVAGDFPGSGLSSSAAVLIAYLSALAEVNGLELARRDIASLVQRAENSYIGLASGLLDPSMMLYSRPGQLTHLDCSDLSVDTIPLPGDAPRCRVLVAFSGVSRTLVSTGYNSRVAECTEAARRLLELAGETPPAAPRFVDVDPMLFTAEGGRLPAILRRRAEHFFGEMRRVAAGVAAWRRGDLAAFGAQMNASGESSIVNYESGTPPLISLYRILRATDGVFGSRFSGAGFGGSCIALVAEEGAVAAVESVRRDYAAAHPELADSARYELCGFGDAAHLVRLDE